VHEDRANAVDRLGELGHDGVARIERFTRRQARQRADDADAETFIDFVRTVEATTAEF
jgi:hypothetical protein